MGRQLIVPDQKAPALTPYNMSKRRGPDSVDISLGFRVIRGAWLQAVSIRTTVFASIDVAVRIEVNMRRRPLGRDIDAMIAGSFSPPVQLHEKAFIWKYVAEIH